jgi:hypothetical protein
LTLIFAGRPIFKLVAIVIAYDEPAVIQLHEKSVYTQLTMGQNSDAMIEFFTISPEQRRCFFETGTLVVNDCPKMLQLMSNLDTYANDVAALPYSKDYPWLVHRETVENDGRVQLCRVENFVSSHAGWTVIAELCRDIISQLLGEEAILFKDKLNFKGPGGGGFAPHQDVTAYATDALATGHITAMVAIDKVTDLDQGPVQFVAGCHKEIYPHEKGVIYEKYSKEMHFEPVLTELGNLVFFSSFIPHRSGPNKTKSSRRLGFLTYNALAHGNLHDAYYAEKNRQFREKTAGPISVNDDFLGDIVPN